MINETDDIKVSVCVVTYNQEKYIAECLDSLVSQETDFKFEIIVGEDCSTDGTRAIVQQYVDKYPDIVKPIFHDQNVGAAQKARKEVPEAVGFAIGRRTSYGSADNLRHLQSVGGYCMTGGRMRAGADAAEE